jgi:hypothetical protein
LCIVSPYVYTCFFSICVQCTDHCHHVETQLQLIHIISYIISHISYHILCIISYISCHVMLCRPYRIVRYHIIYQVITYIMSCHIYHIVFCHIYHIISYLISYLIPYLNISYRIISYLIPYLNISYLISYLISYHILTYHIILCHMLFTLVLFY